MGDAEVIEERPYHSASDGGVAAYARFTSSNQTH